MGHHLHQGRLRGFKKLERQYGLGAIRQPRVGVIPDSVVTARTMRLRSTGCRKLRRAWHPEFAPVSISQRREVAMHDVYAYRYFAGWPANDFMQPILAAQLPSAPAFARSHGWTLPALPIHTGYARWAFRRVGKRSLEASHVLDLSPQNLPTSLSGGPNMPEFLYSNMSWHIRNAGGFHEVPMLRAKMMGAPGPELSGPMYSIIMDVGGRFRWFRRLYTDALQFKLIEVDDGVPAHAIF